MKYIWVCTPYLLITNVYFVFVFTAEGEDNWSSIRRGHQHGRWAAHCASHRGDFSRDCPSSTSGSPLRRSSSGTSTKKAIQEEERLMSDIVSRGEQSMSFQSKVLEMLAPIKSHGKDCLCRLGQGGDDRPASITLAEIPEGMFESPVYLPREKCTIAQFCHPAIPNSAAIFCPSLWHPAAVTSLP